MVDWSKSPDLVAVTLLTCAFASVARNNHTSATRLWLTAWIMIALHFTASIFLPMPGIWGELALFITLAALVWAGELFRWAAVPFRTIQRSSLWMVAALMGTSTLYIALTVLGPAAAWALTPAATLFGLLPLALTLINLRNFSQPLRWVTVLLYGALSIFLLAFQHRPGNGADLALNALLFTVYFGCCINFFYMYRRATVGAFITLSGFFIWSLVFLSAPIMQAFVPHLQVENEVWNLPKYIVAIGMILLLLEDQIEFNKHLALHDELTGLPNRRLFQDRLASAVERARRTGAQAALLLVDLDHFKQVNDTLGHHIGDQLLKRVAEICSGRVRRSDTVARTGGDEFSVILEEPARQTDAENVARSLIQLLNEPIQLGPHTVRIGASIGIAIFPDDAQDMESLCIAADLRMYDNKHRDGSVKAAIAVH
ncbi:MAG: GGDEF domain-containing protein [Terracidiphilus sp.]|jgi:diguanylate cyclase (GGDEF)-like protein